MIVVGIETATTQVGCAIGGAEGVLGSFSVCRGPRHAEVLAPGIEFVCRQAGVSISQISVVAVDVGPGLFTGLRVGLATAKAMAHALRVPMVGISSLDLLAHRVRDSRRTVVAAVDARRGEVYAAFYRHVPGGIQRDGEPLVLGPDALAAELEARGEDVLLVGDGALRYEAELRGVSHAEIAGRGLAHPSAEALVELAHPIALREEFVQPSEIVAMYLRKSDAELNWERREADAAAAAEA